MGEEILSKIKLTAISGAVLAKERKERVKKKIEILYGRKKIKNVLISIHVQRVCGACVCVCGCVYVYVGL